MFCFLGIYTYLHFILYSSRHHCISNLFSTNKTISCTYIRKDGRKEMSYLTTHSTHFIGVGHMVKDHSDCEIGNPLTPHGLLFPILLYAPSHRQDSTYQGFFFYTSRSALAGSRNNHEGSIRRPIAP